MIRRAKRPMVHVGQERPKAQIKKASYEKWGEEKRTVGNCTIPFLSITNIKVETDQPLFVITVWRSLSSTHSHFHFYYSIFALPISLSPTNYTCTSFSYFTFIPNFNLLTISFLLIYTFHSIIYLTFSLFVPNLSNTSKQFDIQSTQKPIQ